MVNAFIIYYSQTGETKEMAQAVVGVENFIDNLKSFKPYR